MLSQAAQGMTQCFCWIKPTQSFPPPSHRGRYSLCPQVAVYCRNTLQSTYVIYFICALFHRVRSRMSVESTSTPLPVSPTRSHRSPSRTPTLSNLGDWSCNLAQTPSSIHSNGSCHTLTPRAIPIHTELHTDAVNESRHSSSAKSSQRRGPDLVRVEEIVPRPNFEPKNLLSLFEETTLEDKQWDSLPVCLNVLCSPISLYELLSLPYCYSLTTAYFNVYLKRWKKDLGISVEHVIKPFKHFLCLGKCNLFLKSWFIVE